ncbi:MAG TPA: HAMP domain-containing sensor histidine kinase [Candidatus Methylomirabilis sp.]|nr:HAMP domain-containing sensor histidine kinase [Candidatus Methylomirabilis sp.]
MERADLERYRLALFGRMVMGVAHEVHNHLSVVLGFSELIQLAAGNEGKVRDGAGKILSAGEKAGAILKNFARYVRPHPSAPEPFLPGDVIPEILLFARYDLARNDVVVSVQQEIPKGILHADRRDFGLVLLALLFNGSEAMAGKGGELGIRASLDASGWEFTVTDQGPGIPAGLEEKVFEEGFTTRTEPVHAGMGLPVARHLVAQAGGTLHLSNRPGGGCAATVRLPPKTRA